MRLRSGEFPLLLPGLWTNMAGGTDFLIKAVDVEVAKKHEVPGTRISSITGWWFRPI